MGAPPGRSHTPVTHACAHANPQLHALQGSPSITCPMTLEKLPILLPVLPQCRLLSIQMRHPRRPLLPLLAAILLASLYLLYHVRSSLYILSTLPDPLELKPTPPSTPSLPTASNDVTNATLGVRRFARSSITATDRTLLVRSDCSHLSSWLKQKQGSQVGRQSDRH